MLTSFSDPSPPEPSPPNHPSQPLPPTQPTRLLQPTQPTPPTQPIPSSPLPASRRPQGREACHALVVALSRALAVVGTDEAMATAHALAALAASASDATAAFAPAIAPPPGSGGRGGGGGVGGASAGAPLVTGVEVVASAEEDPSPTTRMLEVYAEGEAEAPLGVLLLPRGATLAAVRRMHACSRQKWHLRGYSVTAAQRGEGKGGGGGVRVRRHRSWVGAHQVRPCAHGIGRLGVCAIPDRATTSSYVPLVLRVVKVHAGLLWSSSGRPKP